MGSAVTGGRAPARREPPARRATGTRLGKDPAAPGPPGPAGPRGGTGTRGTGGNRPRRGTPRPAPGSPGVGTGVGREPPRRADGHRDAPGPPDPAAHGGADGTGRDVTGRDGDTRPTGKLPITVTGATAPGPEPPPPPQPAGRGRAFIGPGRPRAPRRAAAVFLRARRPRFSPRRAGPPPPRAAARGRGGQGSARRGRAAGPTPVGRPGHGPRSDPRQPPDRGAGPPAARPPGPSHRVPAGPPGPGRDPRAGSSPAVPPVPPALGQARSPLRMEPPGIAARSPPTPPGSRAHQSAEQSQQHSKELRAQGPAESIKWFNAVEGGSGGGAAPQGTHLADTWQGGAGQDTARWCWEHRGRNVRGSREHRCGPRAAERAGDLQARAPHGFIALGTVVLQAGWGQPLFLLGACPGALPGCGEGSVLLATSPRQQRA